MGSVPHNFRIVPIKIFEFTLFTRDLDRFVQRLPIGSFACYIEASTKNKRHCRHLGVRDVSNMQCIFQIQGTCLTYVDKRNLKCCAWAAFGTSCLSHLSTVQPTTESKIPSCVSSAPVNSSLSVFAESFGS